LFTQLTVLKMAMWKSKVWFRSFLTETIAGQVKERYGIFRQITQHPSPTCCNFVLQKLNLFFYANF
jgi:hypothetical protein